MDVNHMNIMIEYISRMNKYLFTQSYIFLTKKKYINILWF